jgi:hypothetical protein
MFTSFQYLGILFFGMFCFPVQPWKADIQGIVEVNMAYTTIATTLPPTMSYRPARHHTTTTACQSTMTARGSLETASLEDLQV